MEEHRAPDRQLLLETLTLSLEAGDRRPEGLGLVVAEAIEGVDALHAAGLRRPPPHRTPRPDVPRSVTPRFAAQVTAPP
jgi:hypothetical protein